MQIQPTRWTAARETRALQIVTGAASLIPLLAGAAGVILGPLMVDGHPAGTPDLDGHFRYLSGLLLGIGLAYASAVPRITRHRGRFLLLGGIVTLGGLGRLLSIAVVGPPSPVMFGALVMELLITPGITMWQWRVSRLPSG